MIGAYILVALLLNHIIGALKHQYADRQPELARMGIGRMHEQTDGPEASQRAQAG